MGTTCGVAANRSHSMVRMLEQELFREDFAPVSVRARWRRPRCEKTVVTRFGIDEILSRGRCTLRLPRPSGPSGSHLMKKTIFLALIAFSFGCAIDDSLPKIDAGPKTTTGNAGSLGASGATGTPGAAGSGLATGGTGGSSGPGAGTGGASAGSGGMGGGAAGGGGMGTGGMGGMGGGGGAGGDVHATPDRGATDPPPQPGHSPRSPP